MITNSDSNPAITGSAPALEAVSTPAETFVLFKVMHRDQFRRGRFARDTGIAGLQSKVRELFDMSPDAKINLTYTDPDGDHVAFSSETELDEALCLVQGVLRLHVVEPKRLLPVVKPHSVTLGVTLAPRQALPPQQRIANMEQRRSQLLEQLEMNTAKMISEIDAIDAALESKDSPDAAACAADPDVRLAPKRTRLEAKVVKIRSKIEGQGLTAAKRSKLEHKLAKIGAKLDALLGKGAPASQDYLRKRKLKLTNQLAAMRARTTKQVAHLETRLVQVQKRLQQQQHKVKLSAAANDNDGHTDSDDVAVAPTTAKARFVKDVSVPDGQVMDTEQAFTKTWRMRNVGTTAWPQGTALVRVGKHSDAMGAPDKFVLPDTVNPGDEYDVAVPMVAPAKPGRYVAYWRLQEPQGRKFGQRIWVEIQVAASSSSEATSDELDDCVVIGEPEAHKEAEFEAALASLAAMGFANEKRNRKMLARNKGNVAAVVERLVLRAVPLKHTPARAAESTN